MQAADLAASSKAAPLRRSSSARSSVSPRRFPRSFSRYGIRLLAPQHCDTCFKIFMGLAASTAAAAAAWAGVAVTRVAIESCSAICSPSTAQLAREAIDSSA